MMQIQSRNWSFVRRILYCESDKQRVLIPDAHSLCGSRVLEDIYRVRDETDMMECTVTDSLLFRGFEGAVRLPRSCSCAAIFLRTPEVPSFLALVTVYVLRYDDRRLDLKLVPIATTSSRRSQLPSPPPSTPQFSIPSRLSNPLLHPERFLYCKCPKHYYRSHSRSRNWPRRGRDRKVLRLRILPVSVHRFRSSRWRGKPFWSRRSVDLRCSSIPACCLWLGLERTGLLISGHPIW